MNFISLQEVNPSFEPSINVFIFAALFALFCLLLFVGAIVHSRCVLILFSVFGLFSIIFLWLLASVYTTSAVAMADFCYDPTPWVVHIVQTTVNKDISSYYLKCGAGSQNPFERSLQVSYYFKLIKAFLN
jgi:hypothetical protein